MPGERDPRPILLTGATGHTGRRMAQRLLERGAVVRALVHTRGHESLLPRHERLEIVYGSAANAADVMNALRAVDTVLHLAHVRYAPLLIQLLTDLHRAEPPAPAAAIPLRVPAPPASYRLIAMSSTRLLSRFPSATREAVRTGEDAIRSAPPCVRWTILRPAMIFGGPDDNNLERMARRLKRSRFLPIFGSGENLVQPIFVWDLVDAIAACLDRPETAGCSYTLAGPEAMTFRAMAQAVARACGAPPPIFVPTPRAAVLFAARLVRRLWRTSPLDPGMIQRFGEDKTFDISEARRDLGFSPTPFADALERKFRRAV